MNRQPAKGFEGARLESPPMRKRLDVAASGEASNDVQDMSLSEQVYRQLRRDILNGVFAPGQSLRLEMLRQQYGSSFSPIREALNRLLSERLVLSTTARGFRISPLSAEEMWDACETRILIDCEALRRSLGNADDSWEARLVGAYHALTLAAQRVAAQAASTDAGLRTDLHEALEARHLDFHQALIAACRSPWLIGLSSQLYAQTERYRRPARAGTTAYSSQRSVDEEHRQLLDAALSRDAVRAGVLLAEHYRRTAQFIEAVLSDKGYWVSVA